MVKQMFPEPTVGAMIFNREGKLFLVKSYKWKGKYVIPGGHIEMGESMEQALKREIKEETGMDICEPELVSVQEFINDPAFWEKRHFIFLDFACTTDSDGVTLNEEAQEYIWVSLRDALTLPVEKHTRYVIEAYMKKKSIKV